MIYAGFCCCCLQSASVHDLCAFPFLFNVCLYVRSLVWKYLKALNGMTEREEERKKKKKKEDQQRLAFTSGTPNLDSCKAVE